VKLRHIILWGILFSVMAAGCGKREPVIARVGHEKVTVEEFKNYFLNRFRTEDNAMRQPYQMREKLLRELATDLALYQEAIANGYDKRPQAKDQVEQIARRTALDELYRAEILNKVISDKAARDFYDKGSEEVKIRHLLLKASDMDTARSDTAKILARIDSIKKAISGGLSFKAAAVMFSEDATSAADSGNLDWIQWGRMVDEFQQAAWKAASGKVVGPVRTMYGYHLILVEEKRPVEGRKPFEEIKEQVKAQLREAEGQKLNDAARQYVADLRKAKKLEYNEANLEVFRKRVMDPAVSQAQELGPMFTSEQKALVAATYKGGKITLADLIEKIGSNAARVNWNEKTAVTDLTNAIVEPQFLKEIAESKGLYRKALRSPEAEAEKRRAVTAIFEKEEITDKVQPTETDERRYYESHLSSYIQPETRTVREIFIKDDTLKAARVRDRARKGDDFAKLTLKFNEKESTKDVNGKLGPFDEQHFGLIGKYAFKLQNIGDVSDVLAVGKNYSIIQLLEIQPSRTKAFEEARVDVKKQVRQSMTDERRKVLEETALKRFKIELDTKALAEIWPVPQKPEDKVARQP
jgi:peptidyl-prolyl cis-trans isomerase C